METWWWRPSASWWSRTPGALLVVGSPPRRLDPGLPEGSVEWVGPVPRREVLDVHLARIDVLALPSPCATRGCRTPCWRGSSGGSRWWRASWRGSTSTCEAPGHGASPCRRGPAVRGAGRPVRSRRLRPGLPRRPRPVVVEVLDGGRVGPDRCGVPGRGWSEGTRPPPAGAGLRHAGLTATPPHDRRTSARRAGDRPDHPPCRHRGVRPRSMAIGAHRVHSGCNRGCRPLG